MPNSSSKNQPKSEEEIIRQRIENAIKGRDEFNIHLLAFIGSMILLWVIWFITGGGFLWPLIPMVGWSIGLMAHWLTYYNKYGEGSRKRQALIEERLQEELARRSYNKAKNDGDIRLHLTEDGELAGHLDNPYFDDDFGQGQK